MKTEDSNKLLYCTFCGRSQHEVQKLIAGPSSIYICNECINLCNDILKEEAKGLSSHEDFVTKPLPTPHEIRAHLDEYVIGQDRAKKFSLLLYIITTNDYAIVHKTVMWN